MHLGRWPGALGKGPLGLRTRDVDSRPIAMPARRRSPCRLGAAPASVRVKGGAERCLRRCRSGLWQIEPAYMHVIRVAFKSKA